MIDIGMFRVGLIASSPVVATQSKPTKPKKHLAAPAITPAMPNGMKPPSPPLVTSAGILSFGIVQFEKSANNAKGN